MGRLSAVLGCAADLNRSLMVDATQRLRRRFVQQRASAKYRGVDFRLTFEQWRDWWHATGHLDERGKHRGQWVMARPADQGAYEIGNLECVRAESNASDGSFRRWEDELWRKPTVTNLEGNNQ